MTTPPPSPTIEAEPFNDYEVNVFRENIRNGIVMSQTVARRARATIAAKDAELKATQEYADAVSKAAAEEVTRLEARVRELEADLDAYAKVSLERFEALGEMTAAAQRWRDRYHAAITHPATEPVSAADKLPVPAPTGEQTRPIFAQNYSEPVRDPSRIHTEAEDTYAPSPAPSSEREPVRNTYDVQTALDASRDAMVASIKAEGRREGLEEAARKLSNEARRIELNADASGLVVAVLRQQAMNLRALADAGGAA